MPNRAVANLAYRPPFAADPMFRFLGDRAIPGVEAFDGRTLRRSIQMPDGGAALIALTPRPDATRITLEMIVEHDPTQAGVVQAVRTEVVQTARRLLDLDVDPAVVDGALAEDPALRPLVAARPGLRLPGGVDGFELAVRAVLGQQITVRGARTMAGRLVELAGTPLHDPSRGGFDRCDGITHLFPTAEQLAAAALDRIGLTRTRAATLHHVAELIVSGDLDLSGHGDAEVTRNTLLAIPGVGPWTVEYVSMRALRDPDAFPATDLGIREGFAALGLSTTQRAIRDHAERWRPWRAYAAMHLWLVAAGR